MTHKVMDSSLKRATASAPLGLLSRVVAQTATATAIAVTGVLVPAGCADAPSRDQDAIAVGNEGGSSADRRKAAIARERERLIDGTKKEILLCADNEACMTIWGHWLAQELAVLTQTERRAPNAQWTDAYVQRMEFERKVREAIPNWTDVRDLRPLGEDVTTTYGVTAVPFRSDTTIGAAPIASTSFNVASDSHSQTSPRDAAPGTVAVWGEGILDIVGFQIAGVIRYSGGGTQEGGFQGPILGGTLQVTTAVSDQIVALSVDPDPRNLLSLDVTGNGTVSIVFQTFFTDAAWGMVAPHYVRVVLPVERTGDGLFHLKANGARVRDLLPKPQ